MQTNTLEPSPWPVNWREGQTEVRRIAVDGLLHSFRSADAAFSRCGRVARSFAGPVVTVRQSPRCPHCWPPPPVATTLHFIGQPAEQQPPAPVAVAG